MKQPFKQPSWHQRLWWRIEDFFIRRYQKRYAQTHKMPWRDYVAAKREALDKFEAYWDDLEQHRNHARKHGEKVNDFEPATIEELEFLLRTHDMAEWKNRE